MSLPERSGIPVQSSSHPSSQSGSRFQQWAREWRRYARLNLEQLEERLPPGSLLGMSLPYEEYAAPLESPFLGEEYYYSSMLYSILPAQVETPPVEMTWNEYNAYDYSYSYDVSAYTYPAESNYNIPTPTLEPDLAFIAGFYQPTSYTEPTYTPEEYSYSPSNYDAYTGFNYDVPTSTTNGSGGYDYSPPGSTYDPWMYNTGYVNFDGALKQSGGQPGMVTNDVTPTLVGTGSAGYEVQVTLGTGEIYSSTVKADGTWAVDVTSPLGEGWHSASVDLRSNGYSQGSAFGYFEIDSVVPVVTLSVDNPYHVTSDPTFQVSIEDGANQYGEFRLVFDIDHNKDGDFTDELEEAQAEITGYGSSIYYNWADFFEGNPDLRVRVLDAAGNEGISNTVEVFKADICDPGFNGDYSNDPEYWNSLAGMAFNFGGGVIAAPIGMMESTEDPTGGTSAGTGGGTGPVMADTFVNETEPNNTTAQANNVTVTNGQRTVITGSINTGTDLDLFRFTLTARSGVFFDIDSRETGLSTTLNSQIAILDSAGNGVTNGTNDNGYDFDTGMPAPASQPNATSADSSLYLDLAPGTYFARVSSVSNTTGNYQFIIRPDSNFLSAPPALSSLPTATKTLYLDFDGHTLPGTSAWIAQGAPTTVAAYDINNNAGEFTPGEQLAIRNIWRVVAEDYAPFNINVTTVAPTTFNGDVMQMLITNNNGAWVGAAGILGVAFLNSFASGSTNDNTGWVFAQNFDQSFGGGISGRLVATAQEIANTASHEAGHTFGLRHYGGTNAGANTNGLMFTPDSGLNREIWRAGPTKSDEAPVETQDDMAEISNATNGIGYRTDDHGNNQGSATVLNPTGVTYSAAGIIAQVATDVDWFRFRGPTTPGAVRIGAYVDDYLNNLRPTITLRDSAGNVLATATGAANGTPNFDAVINTTLGNQDYYLTVASAGGAGEAGQYDVVITLPNPPVPPPPPPGGGGGGSGPALPGDRLENNDSSDIATVLGNLTGTTQTYTALTINYKPDGFHDYDWFRWTAGTSGTASITTTTTSGGDIEVTLYRLDGNTLVELGSNRTPGTNTRNATGYVTAGQTILAQVKGRNSSIGVMDQATYNLDARII